jgi:hypothetical protein
MIYFLSLFNLELETTVFYEMTKCSEANIEYVDVSINGDTDLYLEGDSKLNIEDDSKLNIDADSHLPTGRCQVLKIVRTFAWINRFGKISVLSCLSEGSYITC